MSQASGALPRAGSPKAAAKPTTGTAGAGPRLVKMIAAVALMPVAVLLLTALCDLNFGTLIWNHPATPGGTAGTSGTLNWQALAHCLPGVFGLATLGLTLGLWWKPLTKPEWWLKGYAGRLLGSDDGTPGTATIGGFLTRWMLFEMPLWTLAGLGIQALLQVFGQTVAADAVLTALPFTYGLYFAGLLQAATLEGDLCKQDGFLFTWVSSLLMQVLWVAVGLVFLLQARPTWYFVLDWFQACVIRAVQWAKLR